MQVDNPIKTEILETLIKYPIVEKAVASQSVTEIAKYIGNILNEYGKSELQVYANMFIASETFRNIEMKKFLVYLNTQFDRPRDESTSFQEVIPGHGYRCSCSICNLDAR